DAMRLRIVLSVMLCVASCDAWGGEVVDEWQRLMALGTAHERIGNYAAAKVSYAEAVHVAEQSAAAVSLLSLGLNSLARISDEMGRFSEAERLYRRALTALERAGQGETPRYAVVLSNLGSLYVEDGQVGTGEKLLRQALAIHTRLLPADDERIAAACNGLAESLTRQGKYREAEQRLNQAQAILETGPPERRSQLAITLNNLAVLKRIQGRYQEAEKLLERSI